MLKTTLHDRFASPAPQRLRFQRSAPIYFEGDPAHAWFTVAEGVVRTCRFRIEGQRQLTGFHYPDDVFGLDDLVHPESAEAVTDLSLWCHPTPAMTLDSATSSGERDGALYKALEQARQHISLFGLRTAPERLAAFVLLTHARIGRSDEVELPMSRTDIADYLGLTIHTVSRTLSQLCRGRLIALEGAHRCRVLDRDALQRLAGGSSRAVAS